MFGIPVEFLLFGATLAGVALFHHRTLQVAVSGLAAIVLYKVAVSGFATGPGVGGLLTHLGHEWVILANLAGLLLGFAILSRHFEKSHLPLALPRFLPDDWKGGFALLAIVFVLSAFLDNIAAAMIGAALAHTLFAEVHIGFLAAIVAASNAGGSGSVVGDTTTTMMWIDGVSPLDVLHAYAAAVPALLVSGLIASRQQHALSPILARTRHAPHIDWVRVGIVISILVSAIAANVALNFWFSEAVGQFPVLGVAVWVVILLSAAVRRPDWELLWEASRGALFLLSLVLAASMMPVESLPAASWPTALGLGFILVAAIGANVVGNLHFPAYTHHVPFIGLAVWTMLLATAAWRRPDWSALPGAIKGTIFLLCLVTAATMMPVERLPPASWVSAFQLGFVSAVFDNIPLTKLALEQGGYDWGVLAYAVGFGGSMIWFGSSAGVAITNLFPESRSVWAWVKGGWHVPIAYVAGFATLMLTRGWHPD